MIITLPNDDPGNQETRLVLHDWATRNDRVRAFDSLGQQRYLSLLGRADVVAGNSSSALIEAPSFGLPAINIGRRQGGRVRGANVIDCPAEPEAIAAALRTALTREFRAGLEGQPNPYSGVAVSERVLAVLASVDFATAGDQIDTIAFDRGG